MPYACPALLEYALIDLTTKALFKTVLATYNSFKIINFSRGLRPLKPPLGGLERPPNPQL